MKNIFILLALSWLTGIALEAKVYKVSSGKNLKTILPLLMPGDTVKLELKNWNDQELVFKGNGTELNPIVFMTEQSCKSILSGNSRIKISGNYLVIRDFIFEGGKLTESGSIIEFRTDSKTFANNCRLTNVTVKDINPSDKTLDSKYVSLYGTHNRIDHCSLSGKTNSGATLVVWMDEIPDYHLIDHNYFGLRPDLGVNGGETIRIGTSDWERRSSNCIVEFNLFEECDGEIEIISSKSVGNHYRYNTFSNCNGTLTLRHGSDCSVYGNFFFGNPEKECGGIRIIGPGHQVFNNYLENLTGTEYRAAICLVNGVPNSPANRYRQVENAMVGFNTIINCTEPFAIGAGKDDEKSLPPVNSFIENNLIVMMSGKEIVKDYDTIDGISWNGNMTDAIKNEIEKRWFTITELSMFRDGNILRPGIKNSIIGAAKPGVFNSLQDDIDGQARPEKNKDVGCDQVTDQQIKIMPVQRVEVGAKY